MTTTILPPLRRLIPLTAVASAVLALSACGSGGSHSFNFDEASLALAKQQVAASQIGLPTSGATVTATETPSAATGAQPPASVRATISIAPVDPGAPAIKMGLLLPKDWNGKVVMVGGGGYNGVMPSLYTYPAAPASQGAYPLLNQGYAVFGSDSGHQAGAAGSRDGSFGTNDEAVANFSGAALKKVSDVAEVLVTRFYGRKPDKRYFIGGSTGGREALAVAQKWPSDWDGVVAWYPAWNAASLDLQFGRISRAFAQPGAYPSLGQRKLLRQAALEKCDALDGVKDGLIQNPMACTFRPEVDLPRCANDKRGDTCFTKAQIESISTFLTAATDQQGPFAGRAMGEIMVNLQAFNVSVALTGLLLSSHLSGRISLELKMMVLGGLRILERLEAVQFDVFSHRPTLSRLDWLRLITRGLSRTPYRP